MTAIEILASCNHNPPPGFICIGCALRAAAEASQQKMTFEWRYTGAPADGPDLPAATVTNAGPITSNEPAEALEQLREALHKCRARQNKLAIASGLSDVVLSRTLNGKRKLTLETIVALNVGFEAKS